VTETHPTLSKFTLGLHAGFFGRWLRLIVGGIVPLYVILRELLTQSPSVGFYAMTVLYFGAIFGVYLAAHYLLGERLFAKTNPWVGTAILVGPPVVALILELGSDTFQLGLALYIAVSLVFNFIMTYGGCEVAAIPSLIFGRRYTIYCLWNAVDALDKVIADRDKTAHPYEA
jgi:hypothetical protein